MDYTDCAVVATPDGILKDTENLQTLFTGIFKRLTRQIRRNLPQIAIVLLVLAASACVAYYYYYTR